MKNSINKIKKGWSRFKFKKAAIGILCGIVVIIAGIGIGVSFSTRHNSETEEQQLIKILEDLGKEWYEGYYYEALSYNETPREDFLKKFVDTGLKIDLSNLALHASDGIEEKMARFENKNCDKEETKVIIYPQYPFGLRDYKIETKMQCSTAKEGNEK